MGFFDLSIPYREPARSEVKAVAGGKTDRVKLATKAMELGYVGIAYNHSIKGLMSEKDRCTIPLLTVGSLVKLAPPLASSVGFHRDLLGVPLATPFRQYTRLTVFVESNAHSQALNSGNPILKSYDIVAVRPLNQSAFDQACERAEVDMISIDFSDKMPFRLKHPLVKAAIQRGIFFEITYSDLLMDAQVRRQVISNAKLLVDWTRGKNLIISSGAPSVTELRGPNDVTNLMSLLGLATERARASISKNCRTMVSKALRKKRFYKEAIRVEFVSSNEKFNLEQPLAGDWLGWDPLSSGEGDMHLDDLTKAFGATNVMAPKFSKAIDFASVVDDMPSHGFRVKDINVGYESIPQPPADEVIDVPVQSDWVTELSLTGSSSPNFNLQENQTATQIDGQISVNDKKVESRVIVPQKQVAALEKCCFSQEASLECIELDGECHAGSHLSTTSKNRSPPNSDSTSPKGHVENINASIGAVDEAAMDVGCDEGTVSLASHDLPLRKHFEEKHSSGAGHNISVDDPIPVMEICSEMKADDSSAANDNYTEVAMIKTQKHETGDSKINAPNNLVGEPYKHLIEEAVVSKQVPQSGSTNESKLREESLVPHPAACEETIMEDKKDEETETGTDHQMSFQSHKGTNATISDKSRAKKKIKVHLLPFKHWLHPSRFKRIHRRSKHRLASL